MPAVSGSGSVSILPVRLKKDVAQRYECYSHKTTVVNVEAMATKSILTSVCSTKLDGIPLYIN